MRKMVGKIVEVEEAKKLDIAGSEWTSVTSNSYGFYVAHMVFRVEDVRTEVQLHLLDIVSRFDAMMRVVLRVIYSSE